MGYIDPKVVRTLGVVGCGVVGASWSAYFRAWGLDIVAYEPSTASQQQAFTLIDQALPALDRLGVSRGKKLGQMVFANMEEVAATADFILEAGPERLELKQQILAQLDASARPEIVIASSTSSLRVSELQKLAARPQRIIASHPFNPPHLMPLVEIAGGDKTDADAVLWGMDFFKLVGKKPIRVRKDVSGFIANRMTAALFREAVHLVEAGIASVADVDAAICYGPGLRWALMGPHLLYHLGGGPGGYAHYLAHLGPAQEARWKTLGNPSLSPELCDELVAGVIEEAGGHSLDELAAIRDAGLVDLLEAAAKVHEKLRRDG